MSKGNPQGSVPGTIFWILILNKVLRGLRRAQVSNVNYADDQVKIIERESKKQIEDTGQRAID